MTTIAELNETYAVLMKKASDIRFNIAELTSQREMLTKKIGAEYAYDRSRVETVKEEIEMELLNCRKELCHLHHFAIPQVKKLLPK
jgi:hypothetical protein